MMDTLKAQKRIGLHSRVKVELIDQRGQAEPEEFTIVEADKADLKSGLLGEDTQMGRLLLGHLTGERLAYRVGDLVAVQILEVEEGAGDVDSRAANQRRENVKKAGEQSEITNQMIFATASGSKWGDYDVDVDKLLNQDDEKDEEEK